jgi:hypothetical protein
VHGCQCPSGSGKRGFAACRVTHEACQCPTATQQVFSQETQGKIPDSAGRVTCARTPYVRACRHTVDRLRVAVFQDGQVPDHATTRSARSFSFFTYWTGPAQAPPTVIPYSPARRHLRDRPVFSKHNVASGTGKKKCIDSFSFTSGRVESPEAPVWDTVEILCSRRGRCCELRCRADTHARKQRDPKDRTGAKPFL